jgi:hypothetical protein
MVSDGGDVELDQGQQVELLAELMQAVADSNPEALDIADRLLAALGEDSAGTAALAAARASLDMYDFPGAGEHLQTVSL